MQDATDSADPSFDKGIENMYITGRFTAKENGNYSLVFSRRNTSARSRNWFYTGAESANYTELDRSLEFNVIRIKGIVDNA